MEDLRAGRELAQAIIDSDGRGHIYPAHAIGALEDEIERRGLWREYVHILAKAESEALTEEQIQNAYLLMWRFLRFSPEQRARAFLQVVTEGAEE